MNQRTLTPDPTRTPDPTSTPTSATAPAPTSPATAQRDTTPQSDRISPTADRGPLGDVVGFLPSATLGRELFAMAINVVLIAVLFAVLQPPMTVIAVGAVIAGAILLIRFGAGVATEGYFASETGGR